MRIFPADPPESPARKRFTMSLQAVYSAAETWAPSMLIVTLEELATSMLILWTIFESPIPL